MLAYRHLKKYRFRLYGCAGALLGSRPARGPRRRRARRRPDRARDREPHRRGAAASPASGSRARAISRGSCASTGTRCSPRTVSSARRDGWRPPRAVGRSSRARSLRRSARAARTAAREESASPAIPWSPDRAGARPSGAPPACSSSAAACPTFASSPYPRSRARTAARSGGPGSSTTVSRSARSACAWRSARCCAPPAGSILIPGASSSRGEASSRSRSWRGRWCGRATWSR